MIFEKSKDPTMSLLLTISDWLAGMYGYVVGSVGGGEMLSLSMMCWQKMQKS